MWETNKPEQLSNELICFVLGYLTQIYPKKLGGWI